MLKQIVFYILVFSGNLIAEDSPYALRFEGLFKEIYYASDHDLIEKIIDPSDTILEAGAFDGTDTVRLARMVPQGKVISFEPNPPRYAQLCEKTKNLSNVSTYPFALSSKNEEATFYVCYGTQHDPIYEGASSLLPPAESMKIHYQGPIIKVPSYKLGDWCKEHHQTKIDFMWLDLEGAELQVLSNALRILSTVKAIYVETNFYEFREGMTQYADLKEFLEKNEFRLLAHSYHQGLQGNAIFVRSTLFDQIVKKIASSK